MRWIALSCVLTVMGWVCPLVARAACGSVNVALGYGTNTFGGAWAGQHRDGRNANWADCEVGTQGYQFSQATPADAEHTTFSQPVIGPDNTAWLVVSVTGRDAGVQPDSTLLYRADTSTGDILTRLGTAAGVDRTVSWNSPLVDRHGNVYLGQELPRERRTKCRFEGEVESAGALCGQFGSVTLSGRIRWVVATDGGTLGAQFTSDGNVVFQTWRGTIYVVDPRPLVPPGRRILHRLNSFPDAAATLPDYPGNTTVTECLFEGLGDTCVSANIVAVHPQTDAIYNTVQGWVRGNLDSFIQRWLYDPQTKTVAIDRNWNTDVNLPGGCASSPNISFDGKVIFVNDWVGSIHALDAESGNVLATGAIGYVPVGSNAVAAETDSAGNIIGHFITFQRAMDLEIASVPYMRVMRYRPGAGFQMIRVFDGSDGGQAWLMRRNPIGGIANTGDMAARILFVGIAEPCESCSDSGVPHIVVFDAAQGTVLSATPMQGGLSGTLSLGADRDLIVSVKPDSDGTGSVGVLLHRYNAR